MGSEKKIRGGTIIARALPNKDIENVFEVNKVHPGKDN